MEPGRQARLAGEVGEGRGLRVERGSRRRLAAAPPARIDATGLHEVDRGTAWLTSRRVVFRGAAGERAVPLADLAAVQLYGDAIRLECADGARPVLAPHADAAEIEYAGAVLTALLTRA